MSLKNWKDWAKSIKKEVQVLYLAIRHPGTPWFAKLVGVCVVGYALSPIDLIPDPIPVIGYLDDLIIVPLGILLVRKMIPQSVMIECRQTVENTPPDAKPVNWIAGGFIIAIWIAFLVLCGYFGWRWWHHG